MAWEAAAAAAQQEEWWQARPWDKAMAWEAAAEKEEWWQEAVAHEEAWWTASASSAASSSWSLPAGWAIRPTAANERRSRWQRSVAAGRTNPYQKEVRYAERNLKRAPEQLVRRRGRNLSRSWRSRPRGTLPITRRRIGTERQKGKTITTIRKNYHEPFLAMVDRSCMARPGRTRYCYCYGDCHCYCYCDCDCSCECYCYKLL